MKVGNRNQAKAYLIDAHLIKLQKAKAITGKSISSLISEAIASTNFTEC